MGDYGSGPQSSTEVERIELTIPARPEYIAVVRLAAAGVAGRTALSFDDIEDLKIAVSEACTAVILGGDQQVHVRFEVAPDRLDIRIAHGRPPADVPDEEREMRLLLMRCLMDDVRMEVDGRDYVTWMTKRLPG
ncbi:MAG: ATP-binding protein [Armatimonadota bacterium]